MVPVPGPSSSPGWAAPGRTILTSGCRHPILHIGGRLAATNPFQTIPTRVRRIDRLRGSVSFTDFLATRRAERGRLTRYGQRVDSSLWLDEVLGNAGAALAAPAEDLPTVAPSATHARAPDAGQAGATTERIGP